ncbi:hypothetical protein [Pseudothermotoga sp.]|uniref:hypothetical protein n=1 Tax=Pseudothermotoga sp. TaxID=2033661 RepID=UPI0031F6BFF7
MNCDVCKTNVNIKIYRFLLDGISKEIHLCRSCLIKVLKEGMKIRRKNLKYLMGYVRIVQDSDIGELHVDNLLPRDFVFSIVPIAVLKTLFGKEGENQSDQKEIALRRVYVLKHRLEQALRKEDYRTAHKIKNQISAIEKSILEK